MKKVGTIVLGSMKNHTRANIIMGLITYNIIKADGRKSTEPLRWKVGVITDDIKALNFIVGAGAWGRNLDIKSCKVGDDFYNSFDLKLPIEINSLPGIYAPSYRYEFEPPTYYIEEADLIL